MKRLKSLLLGITFCLLVILSLLKIHPSFGLSYFSQAQIKMTHSTTVDRPSSQIKRIFLGDKEIAPEDIHQRIDYENKQEDLVPIIHEVKIESPRSLIGKELVIEYTRLATATDLSFSILPEQEQPIYRYDAVIDDHNIIRYQFPSWGFIILSYLALILLGIFVGSVTYEYFSNEDIDYFRLNFSWVVRILLALGSIFAIGGLTIYFYMKGYIQDVRVPFIWGGLNLPRAWMVLAWFFAILIYIYPYIEVRLREHTPKLIKIILGIILCMSTIFVTEIGYNQYFEALSFPVILKNAGVVIGMGVIIYGLTLSFRWACVFSVMVSLVFGIINQQLLKHRSEVFIPSNLRMLGVAKQVAGGYTLEFNEGSLLAISLALILIYLAFYLPREKKEDKRTLKQEILLRVGILVGCLSIIFISESNYAREFDTGFAFQPENVYQTKGAYYTFASLYEHSKLIEPKGYNKKAVETYLSNYSQQSFKGKKPHIIVIQSEALANYYGMGKLQLSRDPLAYTHSLRPEMNYGKLFVNVYGGGTVNTEYEVLTGNSLRYFPPGAYPYQQFINRDTESMATFLSSMGYHTLGIHPELASNYGRDRAWKFLGLEDRRFIDHETIAPDNVRHNWVRLFMKDEYMYDYIIREFENRTDESPIFTFLVTMQNHGGYFGEFLSEDNITIQGTQDKPMMEFLNMIETSDKAFELLINYFNQLGEPVVLAIYGDHQPNIGKDFVLQADLVNGQEPIREAYMWSPYYIWTNFPTEKGIESEMSAQYLGEYVLETAFGLENLPAYWQELGKARRELPIVTNWGIYYEGEWHESESTIEENELKFKWLDDMVYYSVMDKSEQKKGLWNGEQ